MPFEKGHQHGAKSRLFDGALRRAIAQDDGNRLRKAAEALLDAAAAGEPWAIDKLADRLDGKPHQSVSYTPPPNDVREMTTDELLAAVAAERAAGAQAGGDIAPGVH